MAAADEVFWTLFLIVVYPMPKENSRVFTDVLLCESNSIFWTLSPSSGFRIELSSMETLEILLC